METLRLVCNEQPKPPSALNPRVPHDLEIICVKCLEKDPAHRYRSARELGEDLDAFLTGVPIKARSYTRWERSRMWVRRRPTAAALLAVSVLAVIAFGVGGVVLARQQTAIARQERRTAEEAEKREKEAEAHARTEAALRKTADSERNRAELNFDEAKTAVRTLTDLGHRRLSRVPNMEPVRRELLAKALAFHRRFLEINGDQPGQRLEVGQSHVRVGEIEENLGRHAEAEAAYQKALGIFTGMLRESPKAPTIRREMATTWNDLAIVQQELNKPADAAASFAESLKIKESLAAEDENNIDLRRELANGLNNRGNLRSALLNQPKEAEADYREALRQLAKVPCAKALENLGETYNNLGAVLVATDRNQAAGAYAEAIRCWKELDEATPGNPMVEHSLAAAILNRAVIAHLQGKTEPAEDGYKTAVNRLVKLTNEYRSTVSYRETLAEAYYNYAKLLRALKRFRDAEKQYRLVLPLYRRLAEELPKNLAHRQKLANSLNELGVALISLNDLNEYEALWTEAIKLQEALVADAPGVAMYWQDLVNSRVNLASVLRSVGKELAEDAIVRLIDVQQRRIKAFPQAPALHGDAAAAHFMLANLYFERKKLDTARVAITESVREQRLAVAAARNEPGPEGMLRTYAASA